MWPSKASPALGCLLIVVVPLLLSILLSLFQSSPARPAARDAVSATASPPLSSVIPSVPGCGGSVRECSGSSNSALIDNMVRRGLITSPSIAAAMKRVDRAHYITRADLPAGRVSPSTSQASAAYVDSPQYIGYGATISAPHMHAMCTELMLPALERAPAGEERRVLDVGSGSGYLAAVLSRVLGDTGRVYGVEHIPELVDASVKNLQADDPSLLQRVHIQPGDGRLGLASAAPFDAIHVGAAAATVPQALMDQLKEGGVLVIPVGEDGGEQTLELIEKLPGGQLRRKTVTGVRYVPLTSAERQRRGGR